MPSGKFPGPTINDVPDEGGQPGIETVPFKHQGIGSRKSGMPSGMEGPKGLDHVGSGTGPAVGGRPSR
jgi:hypothetical protein